MSGRTVRPAALQAMLYLMPGHDASAIRRIQAEGGGVRAAGGCLRAS